MKKVSAVKDEFVVICPFCTKESIWSLNLRWREQKELVCPNCDENMSKVILMTALTVQKQRLIKNLLLTIALICVLIAACLFLVHKFANDLHQMPFFAVLLFSFAAIICSISVAVSIVLTKQLLFLVKRQRLIK